MISKLFISLLIIKEIKEGNFSQKEIVRNLKREYLLKDYTIINLIEEMVRDDILIKEKSSLKFLRINENTQYGINKIVEGFCSICENTNNPKQIKIKSLLGGYTK